MDSIRFAVEYPIDFSLFGTREQTMPELDTHFRYQSYFFEFHLLFRIMFFLLKWQTNDNDKYNHKEKDSCRFFDLQQYWNEYHSYNNDFDLYFYLLTL